MPYPALLEKNLMMAVMQVKIILVKTLEFFRGRRMIKDDKNGQILVLYYTRVPVVRNKQ